MKILEFSLGPIETNSYLAIDDNKNAVLIDCPPDAFIAITNECEKQELNLKAVLLTHSHWDHAADVADFKEKKNVPIYVHKDDEYRMIDPMGNSIWRLPFEIKPCKADFYFTEGEVLQFGDMKFKVLCTPGHTEGSVCFLVEENDVLFSGDTLFNFGFGRTDLPGGDYSKLKKSITEVLYSLSPDITVLPGHGESTTIAFEKNNNRL